MSIVVGVDGSPGSNAALRWAIAEARVRQTPLHAVHAWPFPTAAVGLRFPLIDEDVLSSFREAAEQVLDSSLVKLAAEAEGVEVTRSVVEGAAGQVLVESAKGAELLVVGSRGRGSFSELLLGSVSQQCAHHASCPVVIVHEPRLASAAS